MAVRINPSVVAVLFLTVCVTCVVGLYMWRGRTDATISGLLERMPTADATVLSLDLKVMRDSGLLEIIAGTGVDEEPEYRKFVDDTGFDYRTDLDLVLATFHPADSFFLARGRFEWRRLVRYAKESGLCHNGMCRVPGSSEARRISFQSLAWNTIGLAVSPDRSAVLTLDTRRVKPLGWIIPDEPFWVSIPAGTLMTADWLPVGTQSFARALSQKDRVIFSVGLTADELEAKARVQCTSAQEAAALATELQRVTDLLRSLIRREDKTPNPNDLSGVLSSGVFEHSGFTVIGRWPISREFLEAVAAGGTEEQLGAEAEVVGSGGG